MSTHRLRTPHWKTKAATDAYRDGWRATFGTRTTRWASDGDHAPYRCYRCGAIAAPASGTLCPECGEKRQHAGRDADPPLPDDRATDPK